MNQSEIQEKLNNVFRDIFDDPTIQITQNTTAHDIKGWDSISHIDLIVAVEDAFSTTFTTKEVKSLSNVGELINLISKHAG